MKTIERRLPDITSPISVLPLSDLHIGDSHADIKHINNLLTYVLETDNTFVILDGDLMNTAIAGSKSDFYGETMSPSEQLRRCKEIFKPLADQDKILAVLTGNHEERIAKVVGVNLTEVMCAELGIADLYSSTSTVLFLKFGRTTKHPNLPQVYVMYINHGYGGGGRRVGSKLNSLEDMAKIVTDADVYVCGHTHLPAVFRQSCYVCDRRNAYARQQEQVFVNTASALCWDGSYGDRMGYKPNSIHYPLIMLDAYKHKVSVQI